MLARFTALSLAVVSCCLTGCATPRTSQGLIDINGDGSAESVVVLNRAADEDVVNLHLKKIEVRKKVQVLAEESHASIKQMHAASRVGPFELLASEAWLATANIDLIDATLALARTGVMSFSDRTFVDTDDDGLPDMLLMPLDVGDLLDAKVTLCRALFEQRSRGHERVELLHKSGVASSEEVRLAAQQMYEAELEWLNAQLERQSMRD